MGRLSADRLIHSFSKYLLSVHPLLLIHSRALPTPLGPLTTGSLHWPCPPPGNPFHPLLASDCLLVLQSLFSHSFIKKHLQTSPTSSNPTIRLLPALWTSPAEHSSGAEFCLNLFVWNVTDLCLFRQWVPWCSHGGILLISMCYCISRTRCLIHICWRKVVWGGGEGGIPNAFPCFKRRESTQLAQGCRPSWWHSRKLDPSVQGTFLFYFIIFSSTPMWASSGCDE